MEARSKQLILSCFLLASSLYRAWVTEPLWLDAYFLYTPGWVFLPFWLAIVLWANTKGGVEVFLAILSTGLMFGFLLPLRISLQDAEGSRAAKIISINLFSYETDLRHCSNRIRELEPEIVAFQELWKREHLDFVQNELPGYEFLCTSLDDGSEMFFSDGTFLAIKRDGLFRVSGTLEVGSPRVVGVVLSSADREFAVFSVHGLKGLDWGPNEILDTARLQAEQARKIKATVEARQIPWIAAGDFNAPFPGPALKELSTKSAFFEAGNGHNLTFPSPIPFIGIDHILGCGGIDFHEYGKVDLGSDHWGVLAKFELTAEQTD